MNDMATSTFPVGARLLLSPLLVVAPLEAVDAFLRRRR